MFRGPFVAYLDNCGFRKAGRPKKDGDKPPKVVDATFRIEPLSPDMIDHLGADVATSVLDDENAHMRSPMRSATFSMPAETYRVVFNPEAADEGVQVLALENGKIKGITIRRDQQSDGLVAVFTVTADLPIPRDLALLIDWTSEQSQVRFDIVQPNMLNEEPPPPRRARKSSTATAVQ